MKFKKIGWTTDGGGSGMKFFTIILCNFMMEPRLKFKKWVSRLMAAAQV